MIPESGNIYGSKRVDYQTYTFGVDRGSGHITGMADGMDAMRQAVDIMLNVERYNYPIYSVNFGSELDELIGKEPEYVMSMIKKRVGEALSVDRRIMSVDSFVFAMPSPNTVTCTFTVHTVYGDTQAEVGVGT